MEMINEQFLWVFSVAIIAGSIIGVIGGQFLWMFVLKPFLEKTYCTLDKTREILEKKSD